MLMSEVIMADLNRKYLEKVKNNEPNAFSWLIFEIAKAMESAVNEKELLKERVKHLEARLDLAMVTSRDPVLFRTIERK